MTLAPCCIDAVNKNKYKNPQNRSNSNSFPNYPSHWFPKPAFQFLTHFLIPFIDIVLLFWVNEISLAPLVTTAGRRLIVSGEAKSINFLLKTQQRRERERQSGKIEKHFNVDVQFADESETTSYNMEKSLGIIVDRSSRWWWLCVFLSRVLTRVVQVASFAPNVCDSLSNKLLAIYKFFNLNNMSKRARVQLVGKLTCHQTQTLNFSDWRTRDKE